MNIEELALLHILKRFNVLYQRRHMKRYYFYGDKRKRPLADEIRRFVKQYFGLSWIVCIIQSNKGELEFRRKQGLLNFGGDIYGDETNHKTGSRGRSQQ